MILSCFFIAGCDNDASDNNAVNDEALTSGKNGAVTNIETFSADTFSLSIGTDWVYDEELSASLKSETIDGFYFYRRYDTDYESSQNEDECSQSENNGSQGEDSNSASGDRNNVLSDHLIIVIEDLSSTGKDFDTFKNMTLTQLQSGISTVLTPEETNINGYESFKLKYDTVTDEKTSHNYLISMNIENVIYSFSYTCYSDDFEAEFELFENLVCMAEFN